MYRMLPIVSAFLLGATSLATAQQPDTPSLHRTATGFRADGVASRTTFDATGVRLAAEVPGGVANLAMRLTDWGREGATRVVELTDPQRGAADRVDYRHHGVIERYQVRASGFEQSFVLNRKPSGTGDLVIGIAVDGNGLEADACTAAQQALEFRGQNGAGIRYGEAIAFARGGHRMPVATRYDGAGRIELIVPSSFLETSSYPLVVDPAVGPLFNPGGTTPDDREPDAAHASIAERYMVVWQRMSGSDGRIRGQIWNENGTPATGTITITNSGDSHAPTVVTTVVGGAERFCVVWESNGSMRAQLFSVGGSPVTSTVPVTSPATGERHRRPSVSGMDDTGVMLAWDSTPAGATEANQIQARLLSFANGSILGGVVRVVESVTFGHVRRVRLPKSHVVQTISGTEWVAQRAVWDRYDPFSMPATYEVWTESFRMSTPFGLQSLTLQSQSRVASTSGGGSPEELIDIGVVASTGVDPSDERFLLAWDQNGDMRGMIYNLQGPLGTVPISIGSSYETEPHVLAGACEFSVAYRSFGAVGQDIQVRTIDPSGALLAGPNPIRSGPSNYLSIRGASRQLRRDAHQPINRVLFVWQDGEGPAGGVWDTRAQFYQGIEGLLSPFGSPCAGPGGTLPTIAADGQPDPGNLEFRFEIDNAPPNSLAALALGTQLANALIPGTAGCRAYIGFPLLNVIPIVTNGAGEGSVPMPIPCGVPANLTVAFQWLVYTPGHNAFGWITSDDMDVAWSY